jgi:hypothetical protein
VDITPELVPQKARGIAGETYLKAQLPDKYREATVVETIEQAVDVTDSEDEARLILLAAAVWAEHSAEQARLDPQLPGRGTETGSPAEPSQARRNVSSGSRIKRWEKARAILLASVER